MTWLMDSLDPSRKQQIKAQEKAKKLLKSLGIDPKKDVKLNNYEMMIAIHVTRKPDTIWRIF